GAAAPARAGHGPAGKRSETGSRLKSGAAPATVSKCKAIQCATVPLAWEGDCPGATTPLASPETGLNHGAPAGSRHQTLRRATAVGESGPEIRFVPLHPRPY